MTTFAAGKSPYHAGGDIATSYWIVGNWQCQEMMNTAGCSMPGASISVTIASAPESQPASSAPAAPASAAAALGNQCIPDPDYGPAEPKYPGANCPQGQVTRVQAAFGQGCIGTAMDNPDGASWDPNSCSPPVSTYGLPCENLGPIIGLPSGDDEWSPECYLQAEASGAFSTATNQNSSP